MNDPTLRDDPFAGSAVVVWDAVSGREKASLRGHDDFIRSVALSPDGRTLASEGGHQIKLWDLTAQSLRVPALLFRWTPYEEQSSRETKAT